MASRRKRFAQRRRAAGFSQESLAEALRVDRSTVVRWEAGDSEPQPWLRPKMARALCLNLAELDALLNDFVDDDDPEDERLAEALINPTEVDLVTVALLRQRLHRLNDDYDRLPSPSLLAQAGQCHGQIASLDAHINRGKVRRELERLHAESSIFVGQLVWDASQRKDHVGPYKYFDEAIASARAVKDGAAESYATLRKSYLSLYGEKNPRRGGILARHATDIARPSSSALTGLGLLHVAEASAMLGDRRSCEYALGEAEAQLTKVDDSDVAGEFFSLSELQRMSGSCYLFLDLPAQAEAVLQCAVTALAEKRKSQAIALGNLSLAFIRQGKIDEATSSLHRTIDAVELTRGGGGLNVAFAAGRELRPWQGEPIVQDIHDRLLALMAAI